MSPAIQSDKKEFTAGTNQNIRRRKFIITEKNRRRPDAHIEGGSQKVCWESSQSSQVRVEKSLRNCSPTRATYGLKTNLTTKFEWKNRRRELEEDCSVERDHV